MICLPIQLPPPSIYSILRELGVEENYSLVFLCYRIPSRSLFLLHIHFLYSFIVYRVILLTPSLAYTQKKPQVITSEKATMTHGRAQTMPVKYPTGFV
jgi:hypothetical protein